MKSLSPIAVILSLFGVLLGALWIGAVLLDDWLEKSGRRTISARLLSLESDGIIGILAIIVIVSAFGFIWGSLGGHLWWFKGDTNPIWRYAFVALVLSLAAGFGFGHKFFSQQP